MTTTPPDPSSRVVDTSGRIDPVWDRFFRSIHRLATDLTTTSGTLTSGKAAATQDWADATIIEAPEDKAYTFAAVGFDGEITEVITQTTAGSCTVTVAIAGNDLSGDANSATTTRETTYHDSNNALTDGDDITITVSSTSGAEGLSVTLRGTRTLAA